MNLFIIGLICIFIYILVDLKKALHMLQQNWYNDGNRYLKWIFNNRKFIFFWFDLLFIFVVLLGFINNKLLVLGISIYYLLITIILLIKYKNEQKKKVLVYTSRVKRLCVTTTILYAILSFIILKSFNEKYIMMYYFIFGLLAYFNYYILYLANIINKPIEKLVYLYYKNKALKRLKQLNNMDVIGVTGSYGKTSTKNIINDILNTKYISYPTPQNFNTNYGLIRTINEYMDKYNDYFIAELGAFRKGDIKSLTKLIHPKYGVITKIGTAHLDTFGNINNTCKTKFELIESLPKDGVGFLNMDDDLQVNYQLQNDIKIVWYGLNKDADVSAKNIKYSSDGMSFDVIYKNTNEEFNVKTKLLGSANVYNILAGIAIAREVGLNKEEIIRGVLEIKPIEHRLQLKKYGNINYIDDAYNSNPIGSKMALETLKLMPGKKIVITPGMIEMGDKQYEVNYNFGKDIANSVDLAILVGKEQTKPIQEGIKATKFKEENLIILNDVKEAINLAQTHFKDKEVYILLENDLPDLFNEK